MGRNIGIRVAFQPYIAWGESKEKYYGPDPKSVNKLKVKFFEFLEKKFPKAVGKFGGGWVDCEIENEDKRVRIWDFDVWLNTYGGPFEDAGYDVGDIFTAIFEFILCNGFDPGDGLVMEVYDG